MDTVHMIILVIGLLIVAEALWAFAHPASLKTVVGLYARTGPPGYVVAGLALAAVGVVLCMVVIAHQPLSHWLLTLLGLLAVMKGILCFKPKLVERVVNGLILQRSLVGIRLLYVVALAIGALLVWAAFALE